VVVVPLPGAGGTNGVAMTGASSLVIEDSLFANLANAGVDAGAGRLWITNSTFRNMFYGVLVRGGALADIASTKFSRNYASLISYSDAAGTGASISVSDSVFANDDYSISAQSEAAGAAASVHMTRCTVTHANDVGIWVKAVASAASYVSFGYSMLSKNAAGYQKVGAGGAEAIYTFGNNQFIDNGTSLGALTGFSLL
jgi:hypothetical protein